MVTTTRPNTTEITSPAVGRSTEGVSTERKSVPEPEIKQPGQMAKRLSASLDAAAAAIIAQSRKKYRKNRR